MAARFLAAAALLLPITAAFENTFPVIAWSSKSSPALDHLPSLVHSPSAIYEGIINNPATCDHDVVVVIEQAGLHASDLRSLPRSSYLVKTLASSPSGRQYPYLQSTDGDGAVDSTAITTFITSLGDKCSSRIHHNLASIASLDSESRHIIHIDLPKLAGDGKRRRRSMAEHESSVSSQLTTLQSKFPDLLILYTGHAARPSSHFHKRQSPDISSAPSRKPILDLSPQPSNINITAETENGGILKRYQLLTPGLIMGLLVAFLILLPVLAAGFSSLASIQSPLRVEAPKGYNATTKKNQ